MTQKAIILVRVQPSHRREQLRPISRRCLVASRLNRHRLETAIVARRARLLTGGWLSVSGERKSAFQVARLRSPGKSVCGDRRHTDEDDKPSDHAERRPAVIAHQRFGRQIRCPRHALAQILDRHVAFETALLHGQFPQWGRFAMSRWRGPALKQVDVRQL